MSVYFIFDRENDLVKIGHTGNIKKRLAALQTSLGNRLVLLTYVDGGIAEERNYHARFSSARERGEWFVFSSEIKDYISSLPKRTIPTKYAKVPAQKSKTRLCELLRVAREVGGMTLRDLEHKSGVSNALISQIETGKVENPGIRTVAKLAGALGLTMKRIAETE